MGSYCRYYLIGVPLLVIPTTLSTIHTQHVVPHIVVTCMHPHHYINQGHDMCKDFENVRVRVLCCAVWGEEEEQGGDEEGEGNDADGQESETV